MTLAWAWLNNWTLCYTIITFNIYVFDQVRGKKSSDWRIGVIKYKWRRCSKKKCCKQCGQVKFMGTMTKWPVQKHTEHHSWIRLVVHDVAWVFKNEMVKTYMIHGETQNVMLNNCACSFWTLLPCATFYKNLN